MDDRVERSQTGEPLEIFQMFSYEGADLSFVIYMFIERNLFNLTATVETWIYNSDGSVLETIIRSSEVNLFEYVRGNLPSIQAAVNVQIARLIYKSWRAIALALPAGFSPKTYPAFAWEIITPDTLEEIRDTR